MTISNLNERYNIDINTIVAIESRIKKEAYNAAVCTSCLNEAYKLVKDEMGFYYVPKNKYLSPLYKGLIDELTRAEICTTFSTFIIPDKPEFDYQKRKHRYLNRSSDEDVLNYLIEHVWYNYAQMYSYSYPKSLDDAAFVNKSEYFSAMISMLCKSFDIPCYEITINPGFLANARLYDGKKYHKVCIVKLKKGYYLLDPSYRQFFLVMNSSLERIGVPLLDGASAGAFMVIDPERKALAQNLITKGHIELTDKTFKDYCDGFAMSFRNGIYYKTSHEDPYKTDYNADDYIRFFQGKDNQVNHEGVEVLQRQRTPY